MKTYVLTVSRYFPAKHPRRGDRTYFPDKICLTIGKYEEAKFIEEFGCLLTKIHTIRANYDLWKKRIDEVNAGEAVLSLRYWTGKPYNSKQQEFARLDKSTGIGVQKLTFSSQLFNSMLVDGHYCFTNIETSIAKNDGLSFDDFEAWFKGYDLSKPMAIIHFTEFRY